MDVNEVIAAIETRLEMIGLELKSRGKHDAHDVYLDCVNAVKEVKCLSVT